MSDQYWFARHSKSIIFLICVLTAVGVYEALTLPVAVFPTTNFPRIIIGVENGVMPIEQMEIAITRPIEEAVRIVPGLEDVRSVSSRGSAEINLFFNWNVDMLETLQMVDAAVSRVQSSLPATAHIRTNRLDFSSFPIIGYSLTSDTVPQTDLWELATYEIKPRLNGLPGVASVLVQGGQRPEFHVIVEPARMLRAKTSIADILNAANRTNIVDSPGLLNRHHQLFLGLVTGQVHGPEEIGDIVVKHVNNVPVHIKDVGTPAPAVEPVYTVVSANGKPALLLSVNRQLDSNTAQVADEVHQEMAAIQPTLPAGVEMRAFYDQSNIVHESIGSVRDAIVIGLFLAGLIIWLFLRDWGTAIMTGLVVPVTMVVTFIAMKILGQSFNLMTLGGLAAAVGLVIDDKIVVVENIVLHRDGGEGPAGGDRQRVEGAHGSADRVDAHADCRLPAADHDYRRHRDILPVARNRDERLAADVARARAGVDEQPEHAPDSPPPVNRHAGWDARRALQRPSRVDDSDARAAQVRRMMTAEDASFAHGAFSRLLLIYEHVLRRAVRHPVVVVAMCVVLVGASYRVLRRTRQRSPAGVRRRRIRARLRDAAWQLTPGDQPRRRPHRIDPARHARGREHIAPHRPGARARRGHRAKYRRHRGETQSKTQPRRRRRDSATCGRKWHLRSRVSTSSSFRCCRT